MKLVSLLLLALGGFTSSASAQLNPVIPFKKVVWIWMENTSYENMAAQKYMRYLWLNYPSVRFTQMKQVSPITQANTVAMISGNDYGINNNEMMRLFTPTIINLMESKSVTWKVYAEQYPGACYTNEGMGEYKRYRNPFISISQIQTDRYLCSKIVSFSFLQDDLKFSALPQVSIVIPSLRGSGATSNINSASNTIQNIVEPILYNADLLAQTTIIISTTTNTDQKHPELFTMILGNGVVDYALTNNETYNHYNLLRTIENGFNLGHLNQNDAKAEPMLGFWRQ